MQQEIQEAWNKILPSLSDKYDSQKQHSINEFLKSKKELAITIDDVIEMINDARFIYEDVKINIFLDFLKREPEKSSKTTSDDVIKMINGTNIASYFLKQTIIQGLLNKNESFPITIDDFIRIFNGANFTEDWERESIIGCFVESTKLSAISSGDIIKMIENAKIAKDYQKADIINLFLKSPISFETTSNDVIKMINQTVIKDDYQKANIFVNFLKSPKSSKTTSNDVIEMINQTGIKGDTEKANIIQGFLKSPKSPESSEVTSNHVIEMINQTGIKDDVLKGKIILDFLKSPKSPESSEVISNHLIEMINQTGIKDDVLKGKIILDFLKSPKSSAITYKVLANMIKGVGLQNRADFSIELYQAKFSASENYIDFTKVLHQSEAMQCEFVKEFIKKNQINQGNVMGLKPFIEGLQDNELALDLIENLSRKGILVDEKDTLSLVKNRSKKQYAFLTETVGNKTLNDCFTLNGIEILKATFGDDLQVGDQSITVSDLISYYDLKDQAPTLSAMLKPEFKQQLRDKFAPSAGILLYKSAELDKLNSLLSEEGVAFDVKSYFVENATLCDYLNKKVGNVKEIDPSKTYQINFANFGIEEGKKAEINTLFNELLKSDNPNEAGVAKFFSDLLGIDLSVDDGKKLKIFFQQNKKELAHCFCDKELPKENFESLFTTLRDGCFANIGTQFTSMLYGAMIKDGDAEVLYGVMSSKIIAPIGANQDINHHGQPLDNSIIKSYYVSTSALIEQLSKEEMLTNAKTWEIIGKNLGDDHQIIYRLGEKYPKTSEFNQKAKEIASYLIVKKVIGEEKMEDLENKNPQLKELGNLIYDRAPEASPGRKRATSSELSGPPTTRSRALR